MSTSSTQKLGTQKTLSNSEVESIDDIYLETKCKTVEQNELEMQAQRILYIFDKAIYKIRIVALLPRFLRCRGKILRGYLPKDAVDYIVKSCEKYFETQNVTKFQDQDETSSTSSSTTDETVTAAVIKDIKEKVALSTGMIVGKRTSQLDINITQAIDYIFFCEPLRYELESHEKYTDETAKTLIELIQSLRDAAHKHLIMSASKERNYQAKLRKYFRENKDTMMEINKIQELLDKQRLELGSQIEERDRQIKQCLNDIDVLRETIRNNIKEIMYNTIKFKNSERTMIKKTRASDTIRVVLAEQAKLAEETYKQLLEAHLSDEKVLRVKLDKIEVQLSQWLAKYDQEIGDKQGVKEQLESEYDQVREETHQITTLIAEQDALFTALMLEKEREEHEINMAIADEFCRNRAATIIQKCWKDYKLRKWLRKMAKKAKKMKKTEEKVIETPIEIDTAGLFDDLPGGNDT